MGALRFCPAQEKEEAKSGRTQSRALQPIFPYSHAAYLVYTAGLHGMHVLPLVL